MVEDAAEYLLSVEPLVVRRRVMWGECDPAGVVYTPRFTEYAVSARDYWFRHVLKHLDRPHPSHKRVAFPMRAMRFDFTGMLAPDDIFDMCVTLDEVRQRSLTLSIEATHEHGHRAFTAFLTHVAFDQSTGAAVPFPEPLRERLAMINGVGVSPTE